MHSSASERGLIMARKRIDPERVSLLRRLEESDLEYDPTWPTEVLKALAAYTPEPKESKPEVYGAPKRERKTPKVCHIQIKDPALVQMMQGSGEVELRNVQAQELASVIGEVSPVERTYYEEHEERKRLFPKHSLTDGADAEYTRLRAWARARGYNAQWPRIVLERLRELTEA
jgi:hypothetical protein